MSDLNWVINQVRRGVFHNEGGQKDVFAARERGLHVCCRFPGRGRHSGFRASNITTKKEKLVYLYPYIYGYFIAPITGMFN